MKLHLIYAALLCMILSGCPGDEREGQAPPAARDADLIRVDLNLYTPGTIPMGIGEPVQMARVLADEWEKLHGGKRIKYQQIINPNVNSEGEWLKTQLMGGVAPEIITQNAEIAWQDTDKGWYVPLDPYLKRPTPYVEGNPPWIETFANQALVGAKRAPDGKLYCVPMDIVETGIFYNKRLLAAAGVHEPPETWAEMMIALEKLQESPETLIPFTADLNLAANWGQDIIFELLYHDIMPMLDVVPSREDAQDYLGHYLDSAEAGFLFTKGFFTRRDPRWVEMNRLLIAWRQYWARELKNADPIRMFLTERLAMYWSGSWLIRRMATDPYIDFEWGITYLPTITQETSPFGAGTPATVVGGAAIQLHITNSAIAKGNIDECIDFLMYITAPQNIERLASEALVYVPNIKGAKADPRLDDFSEIFKRPYCAMKWLESFDGRYKTYWQRLQNYFLEGGVGLEEYMALLEENFAEWVEAHRGDAAWDFATMEQRWAQHEEALEAELWEWPMNRPPQAARGED